MKRKILLVDDELAILLTLKAILEINGFEAETAISAAEARQKLAKNTYHMVITDMRMESDTAGYEVIRAARKCAYNPAVALLTAFPLQSGSWKEEGADSLLVKPMNTNDLLRQIEALLVAHEDTKRTAQSVPVPLMGKRKNAETQPQQKPANRSAAGKR